MRAVTRDDGEGALNPLGQAAPEPLRSRPGLLREFFHGRSVWFWRIGVSLVDQMLLSGVNFAVGWVFIRGAPKEQYAHYTLALGVVLFATGVQNALITAPMTVLAPRMARESRREFVRDLLFVQTIAVSAGLVLLAVGIVLARWMGAREEWVDVGYALLVAVFGVLIREFGRAAWVMVMRPGVALALDCVYAISFLTVLSWLFLHREVGAWQVLLAMGGACLLTVALELEWVLPYRMMTTGGLSKSFGRSWRHGRWALGGVSVTWLQAQSYPYLLGLFGGASAVADVAAARLILMPVSLLGVSWNRLFAPKGAEWMHEGRVRHVRQVLYLSTAGLASIVVAYSLGLWMFFPSLERSFFGERYEGLGFLVALWSAMFVVGVVRSTASVALQFLENFRELFHLGAWGALLFLAFAVPLIKWFGAGGSVVALILGEIVVAVWCWLLVSRILKRRDRTAAVV